MEVLRSVGAKGSGALVSYSGAFHPPQKENQMSFLLCCRRNKCVTVYGVIFLAPRVLECKESEVTVNKLVYKVTPSLSYSLSSTSVTLQCIFS